MKYLKIVLSSKSGFLGVIIVAFFFVGAAIGPFLTPQDPLEQNLRQRLLDPGTSGHLFGTDDLGRDVLSRVVYGARISLLVAIAAVAFGLLVGIPVGLVAGYYQGIVDTVLMRVADVLLSLPRLLMAILIAAIYGFGFWGLVVAIGFPAVPVFARLARAATLTVKNREYIVAAASIGGSGMRIIFRHVLPNLIGPLAVQTTFDMAHAVLTTGGLSFLGLGIQPPTPEWGSMMAQGRLYIREAPHLIGFPGLALASLVLGVNLLGDALQKVYDPRFRGRENA